MASSRRTYDTDVITLRKVFAKDPANSNVPALRTLTADGQGGTYWAVPSTLGVYPAFNRIITSAGTYTADLSYNTFRLTAGENMGMVNGSPGSNETYLFAKAFSQLDVSGENSVFAFTNNQLDSSVTLAGEGGITLRADPATNTLFFVGPASNAYTVSTGIYGFSQLKVIGEASSITSSIQSWNGNFLTATSPSTLLTFVGYNDIQMSTNVTTNSVFFTISTFTSRGYLDISAQAYSAYPSSLSTMSSLYVQIPIFNSTIAYLSSSTGFSFSSVVSSIDALAISTADQFYILSGLINARATIVQLNNEISNVNTNIQSTSIGLGTLGYISTGGGGAIGAQQLVSTVEGLGSAGYLSTAGGGSGDVTTANLTSTVVGLGTSGYVSSLSTIITSTIFNTGAISTYSLEVFGPATLTNSGSTILRGPVYLAGPTFVAGSITGSSNTLVSPTNLASTVSGLGTARYISSSQLQSSMAGIGTLGYLSALRGFSLSSGNVFTSSLNLLDVYTNEVNFLTVSSGSLLVNGAKISGGGGGGGNVAQIVAGTGITISPPGGTGVVTITNTGATTSYVDTAISSFSTALGPVGGGGSGSVEFSTISTSYGSSFTTFALFASTLQTVNVLPPPSNVWVAVGYYNASASETIQYSGNGSNWSNSTSGGFSSAGKGVAYNGSLWVAVGNNGSATGSIQVSKDGRSWTNASSGGFASGGNGVAWNGSYWIAVGNNGPATTNIQISTDGSNWSAISTGGFSVRGSSVAWNGSYWIAVGEGASAVHTIQYSLDGRNWSNASSGGFTLSGKGIAWNGSLWVAAGDDTTRPASLQYSGNGRNWSNASSGGFLSAAWNVAWNGKLWVAVGDETTALQSIQYSLDGSNWNNITSGGFGSGNDGYGVSWNGNLWVATGIGGSTAESIQYSRDGLRWSNSSSGGFSAGGVSVAFSSNIPAYKQEGLTILSQNIPSFLNSTNQIMAQPSSLLINTTLLVDNTYKTVGINCNTPAYTLDVNGIGHFLTVSTLGLNISSINGVQYNDAGSITSTVGGLGQNYVSTLSLLSTTRGLQTSGFLSTTALTSTTFGLQTSGFLSTPVITSTTFGLITSGFLSTPVLTSTTFGLQTSGFLSTPVLTSTTFGLQTSGFLSTPVVTSTVAGLGQNYVSTLSLLSTTFGLQTSGFLSTTALTSTTFGLQTSGFLSTPVITSTTFGLITSGFLSTPVITSTTFGLITSGFLSTPVVTSTVAGLGQTYVSTLSLLSTTFGLRTSGFLSTTALTSTTFGLQTSGFLSTPVITSTTFGLITSGFLSTPVVTSTVAGLGQRYVSSLINVVTLSSLALNVSSINGALPGTGSGSGNGSSLTVSTGSLYAATTSTFTFNLSAQNRTTITQYTNTTATTFTATGTSFTASMFGAGGGGGNTGAGGAGAYIRATFSVNPGDSIKVRAGAGGNGGGGTATYVINVTQNLLLAVIGAGGGGGTDFYSTTNGGAASANGTAETAQGNYAGEGATPSSGGAGGSGADSNGTSGSGPATQSGGTFSGGDGGNPYGGSGYFGGGGGGFTIGEGYGGGGGGSSYINTSYATSITYGNPSGATVASAASSDPYYSAGVSAGGGISTPGGNGKVAIVEGGSTYNMLNIVSLSGLSTTTSSDGSMYMNNTLFVNTTNKVGVNTANPLTDLDVNGTGRFLTLSTLQLNASSINAFRLNVSTVTTLSTLLFGNTDHVTINTTSNMFYVAIGSDDNGNTMQYSYDAFNWLNGTNGFATSGQCVAYNGTLWVAGGEDGTAQNRLKWSLNGINWSNSIGGSPFNGTVLGVEWNGYMWVAVGGDSAGGSNTIKYSYDGKTWNNTNGAFTRSSGSPTGWGITWSGSTWVASGTTSNSLTEAIKYSGDGINWSNSITLDLLAAQTIPSFSGYDVHWDGVKFIATFYTGGVVSGQNDTIKYSYDGRTWYRAWAPTTGINYIWWGIYPNGQGQYLGTSWPNNTGSNAYTVWVNSNNGISSFAQTYPGSGWPNTIAGFPKGVIWDGKRWIVGARAAQTSPSALTTIQISHDGVTWTQARSGGFVGAGKEAKGLAFNSNYSFRQTNLDIYDNASFYYRSTNMIVNYASSMMINNTLTIDRPSRLVGINTYGPRYPLEVEGSARISSLIVGTPTTNPSTTSFLLTLTSDSATKPFTTAWTAASDQRVKENIMDADIDRCYNDIKAIPLRRFTWASTIFEPSEGYDRRVLGFIAQEVSSIVPKTVRIGEGWGFSNFHYLNVDQLHMALYGAVKRTISDKEVLESTIKGQAFTIQTLMGSQTMILSTLNGLQGR